MGIVYISHKMDELQRIADRVTVMRDGQLRRHRADGATTAIDKHHRDDGRARARAS